MNKNIIFRSKKQKITVFAACCLAMLLIIGTLSGCSGKKVKMEPSGSYGDKEQETDAGLSLLKSFEANCLDGSTFTQDDLAEKDVTVINFWALTCGPCIREMPEIAEFEKSLPDNVQLITVCLDGADAEDIVKDVLEEAGYEGITLLDGDGDFAMTCRAIMYTPTTVLVDSEGTMLGDAIIGGRDNLAEVYLEAVNSALKGMGKEEIGNEEN